ncbi:MAG: hypothetical protein V1664_03580 [Candidatus Uhrbacteria bacterium]
MSDDFLTDDFDFEPEPEEAPKKMAPDPRLILAKKILKQLHESLGNVLELLDGGNFDEANADLAGLMVTKKQAEKTLDDISGSRVIEGVFDGQAMIGSDGKSYAVPPNYASKSRLVEGDMLKLTIKKDGSFLFKQIGPIERSRVVGKLAFDASENIFVAICGEQTFKLANASVSFFHGEPGDDVIILVPKNTPSVWAAVENVVKK